MCSDCAYQDYVNLARELAEKIDPFKTRSIAFCLEVADSMTAMRHCTERQREVLDEIASQNGIGRSVRLLDAKTPELFSRFSVLDFGDDIPAAERAVVVRILVTPLKSETTNRIAAVLTALRAAARSPVKFIDANALDWRALRHDGDVEASYRIVARHYDACVLIENTEGLLGRGQFEIASNFRAIDKRVLVFRDAAGKAVVVEELTIWDASNWKRAYGRAYVAGEARHAPPIETTTGSIDEGLL